MSTIVPSSHTGTGAWVNSKMYTSILYNIINYDASVYRTNTEYTGSLGTQFVITLHLGSGGCHWWSLGQQYIMSGVNLRKGKCVCVLCVFKETSERICTFWASPSQGGGGHIKTFRWDHRLQRQKKLFMAFKRVPDGINSKIGSTVSFRGEARSPPLYYTLILITMHSQQS